MITLFLIGLVIFVAAYYYHRWVIKNNNFFIDRKIPALIPKYLFGNTGEMISTKISIADLLTNLYNKFPNESIMGFFDQRSPLYLIRDPELIKLLAVKEFDHFLDHRQQINPETDPLFGKSLFGLRGHEWKEMRSTLSPAFTGSKMRTMFDLVCKCSDDMAKYCLEDEIDKIFEIKDFFSRFSNDVIATCAFGIEVNSLKDRKNEFYGMGERLTKFGDNFSRFKFFIMIFVPYLAKKLGLTFFNKEDTKRFQSIILDTMKIREEQNIIRPDMINLLMIARRGQSLETTNEQIVESNEFSVVEEHLQSTLKKNWSDIEIAAQCFLFFFAGFDTISTAMSFMAYELALNPDIQDTLIEEVDRINDELEGKPLTYDKLQQMKYMDMVVSETLRKWPPAPSTDRCCTNELKINYNKKEIRFEVGDIFWIPIYPIHRDPQYYPNPDLFDPERFSENRKHEINPNTYMPFGVGPRNCIGSRFALMEAKAAFYSILKYFKFEICEKTEKFEFGRKSFRMLPDNGIFLRITPKKKIN